MKSQHELIVEYVEQNGSICPARLSDRQRQFKGGFIGSEAGKRCRELRGKIQGKWCNPYGKQMLDSHKEGKFEVFYPLGHLPEAIVMFRKTSQIFPDTCCYSKKAFGFCARDCETLKKEPAKGVLF